MTGICTKRAAFGLGYVRWAPAVVALALAAGCASPPHGAAPIEVEPVAVDAIDFDDLAVVLAATVGEGAGAEVDATALAVHLARLGRQTAQLAGSWPDAAVGPGSDMRLAWLYNARAAWSLRIVAREMQSAGLRGDRFILPEAISYERLTQSSFVMDGRMTTLAAIDRELAGWDDYRIGVLAPGATDLDGPLPREPFDAETVRSRLDDRFDAYLQDEARLVIDHADRVVRIPPALALAADGVVAAYNRRFATEGATLTTALRIGLGVGGRRRMEEAMGYRTVVRDGPVEITAAALNESRVRFVLGD